MSAILLIATMTRLEGVFLATATGLILLINKRIKDIEDIINIADNMLLLVILFLIFLLIRDKIKIIINTKLFVSLDNGVKKFKTKAIKEIKINKYIICLE